MDTVGKVLSLDEKRENKKIEGVCRELAEAFVEQTFSPDASKTFELKPELVPESSKALFSVITGAFFMFKHKLKHEQRSNADVELKLSEIELGLFELNNILAKRNK